MRPLRQPVFQIIAALLSICLWLYAHPIARTIYACLVARVAGELQSLKDLLLVAWSRAKYVPVSVLHHHSLPLVFPYITWKDILPKAMARAVGRGGQEASQALFTYTGKDSAPFS